MSFDLENRCNYFATAQALILNKLLIDLMYLNPDSTYDTLESDSEGSFSSIVDSLLFSTKYFK